MDFGIALVSYMGFYLAEEPGLVFFGIWFFTSLGQVFERWLGYIT